MLIVTLKEDEKILTGDKITVRLVEIRGKQIRLGIEAPADLLVLREKLAGKVKASRSTGGWVKENPREHHQDAGQTLPDRAPRRPACIYPAPLPE
jgi:carbon storage regulator